MPILQELNRHEISQVIVIAAERKIPLSLTVAEGQQWSVLSSRVLGVEDGGLLLEWPQADSSAGEPAVGGNVGVSLKLKHHKYLFLAGVVRVDPPGSAEGAAGQVLVLGRPARMQRLQRRAYVRASVPDGCVARVAFWVGGHRNEPAGTSPDRPVWRGRLLDLSAGGFSVETTHDSLDLLESGYLMGTRLLFGVGQEAVYADASIRHIAPREDSSAVVGFQFVGLEHSDIGRKALSAISRKVAEYQAAQPRENEVADPDAPAQPTASRQTGSLDSTPVRK